MYRLRWKEAARLTVQARWITANPDLRRRISVGVQEAKRLLEADPFGQGESREPGRRIMYVDPLWITYEIDRRNSIVRVVDVNLP